jgi:hypothetical protein
MIYNKQVVCHYYYNKKWIKAQRFWQLKSIEKSNHKAKIKKIMINKKFNKEILII